MSLAQYKRDIINFETEGAWLDARLRDVTSTESACLLGEGAYGMTPFKLWYKKANGVLSNWKPNERMTWGTRLEPTIAEGIAEDHGFKVEPFKNYIRIPSLRLGSSFDFRITGQNVLFEIKNVGADSFKDWWVFDDKSVAAPPHIEIQVQHQLLVSGFDHAYIGVLIGGNKSLLVRRERNEKIIQAICTRVEKFWRSVDGGVPPRPDLSKDCEAVREVYAHAEPGKVISSTATVDKLAERHRRYSAAISKLEKLKAKKKAEILMKIDDAESVNGRGYSISAGLVGPALVPAYERKGYRLFKVSWRKRKKPLDNGKG